jgi:hypothetical protein
MPTSGGLSPGAALAEEYTPLITVGKRSYFYRSERRNGRPVRVYVGAGEVAELAAAAEDLRRLDRTIAIRERQAELARRQEAEKPLVQLCEMTDVLVRAALAAAGFYQHSRGPWRKSREHGRKD